MHPHGHPHLPPPVTQIEFDVKFHCSNSLPNNSFIYVCVIFAFLSVFIHPLITIGHFKSLDFFFIHLTSFDDVSFVELIDIGPSIFFLTHLFLSFGRVCLFAAFDWLFSNDLLYSIAFILFNNSITVGCSTQ